MTELTRRSLLASGLSAATLAALPPAVARAVSIPADVRTGTIRDVEHVVILMQENRSFDHYFGAMRGVRGFGDRFPIPVAGNDASRTVWQQLDRTDPGGSRLITPFHLSVRRQFELMRMEGTPHAWPDAQAAWDEGRMGHWPEAKTQRAMGYFRREDIPFQFALADAFTLCDAYFCSMQAGTNPNRLFLWTGTNDPSGTQGGPAIGNSHDNFPENGGSADPYLWTTYVERLQAAGVDWRIYQDMADNFTDNPLPGFAAFRAAWRNEPGTGNPLRERGLTTHWLDRLRADAMADRLPQVSYIIADAKGSEHPGPSSPAQGADFTARVLDALTANPEVWSRTVFLLMFDENDGFFDHVPPPAPPSHDATLPGGYAGASTVSTEGEYHLNASAADGGMDKAEYRGRPYGLGPRVPLYAISPWSRGGWTCSQVFDHTSVIRFLEARFGVEEPNISPWRRAVCGDLTSAFDFTRPNDAPFPARLPDPQPDARRAALIPKQIAPTAPEMADLPMQEPGVRPSRPLPYALEVGDSLDASSGTFHLTFGAGGSVGAVFHVYDRLNLQRVPRRYTVEPGRQLTGAWPLVGDDGVYDLWVLGPNGFHRHFQGDRASAHAVPRVRWRFEAEHLVLAVALQDGAHQLLAAPAAYAEHHGRWHGRARKGTDGQAEHSWSLRETGGWYDMVLTCPASPRFRRRLAGRLETGRPSITDPA